MSLPSLVRPIRLLRLPPVFVKVVISIGNAIATDETEGSGTGAVTGPASAQP